MDSSEFLSVFQKGSYVITVYPLFLRVYYIDRKIR
ncbi:hypothetical protein CLOBOL_04818 [Enterocloster bolteae ATCC BAA-613]|uniref:Uncharacterized protein n=1 Tax=Enterocloster bolteae (strain ATCC BAA-613 / DSM 15670 / CCUG 46953 / JCM 12243 / WAL 16351) TaxID=411902 RepID=A8RX78_ENTBW|nr:hypothetical protein CLOBOL_04818 [Enterocloster bolteae ATCC BAA-613]